MKRGGHVEVCKDGDDDGFMQLCSIVYKFHVKHSNCFNVCQLL